MKNLKSALEKLENSKVFKEWKKNNKDAYLCGMFMMSELSNINHENWQIDFFHNKSITSFILGKEIKLTNTEEIFTKDNKIEELDMNKVKINLESAMKLAMNVKDSKYSDQNITKAIIILQASLWTITFLTSAFKVLNVKIDNSSGEIIDSCIIPIMDFKAKDPC